jgi:hypothetical protein
MITAIDMPGCLSGLDLARFAMRRPHIGIIVLGWPTLPTPSLAHAVTFLPKPCPPASVVEQVRAALAAFSYLRDAALGARPQAGLSKTITFDTYAVSS